MCSSMSPSVLKIETSNRYFTQLDVARVCVEVDLEKDLLYLGGIVFITWFVPPIWYPILNGVPTLTRYKYINWHMETLFYFLIRLTQSILSCISFLLSSSSPQNPRIWSHTHLPTRYQSKELLHIQRKEKKLCWCQQEPAGHTADICNCMMPVWSKVGDNGIWYMMNLDE